MSIRNSAILTLLFWGGALLAQQAEIPIATASQIGAPVILAGAVIPADSPEVRLRYSYKVRISVTNVSEKPILLTIAQIGISRQVGEDEHLTTVERTLVAIDDYFFRSELLDPGGTKHSEDFLAPFTNDSVGMEQKRPEVAPIGAVLFVQFADGSSWGSRTAAEQALRDRALTLERLRFLQETYRTAGEQRLVAELLKPSQLVEIRSLQELYKTMDLATVIERIALTSRNGDSHLHGLQHGYGGHPPG